MHNRIVKQQHLWNCDAFEQWDQEEQEQEEDNNNDNDNDNKNYNGKGNDNDNDNNKDNEMRDVLRKNDFTWEFFPY